MVSGWKKSPISTVGEIVTGNTPPKKNPENYGQDYVWVRPPELHDNAKPVTSSNIKLSKIGIKKARILPRNSVMVCCIGSIGKIGIAGVELATNQQINSIIFDESIIEPEYGFYYFLRAQKELENMAPKAVVPIINKGNFSKFEISYPSLPEQKRIVEILKRAEGIVCLRREQLAKTRALIPALFIDMFGDPATNPKGWDDKHIGDIGNVVTGNTPSTKQPKYYEGSLPWIRPAQLGGVKGIKDSDKNLSNSGREVGRTVRKNSTLVCCIGSIGKVGICEVEVAFNQQINAVEFNPEIVNPFYGWIWCQLSAKKFMDNSVKSTLPILNKSKFSSIRMMVPPLEAQNVFGNKIQEIRIAEELETVNLQKQEALFQSLLHHAFAGTLSPAQITEAA